MKVHAKSNEDVFEKMSVGEAVRTMAVPAVAAQLIVLIYNLADTFYVGRTNNPFMVAGVSLILPLFNVAVAVGALFGAGGGALLPRLLAVDRKDEATRVSAYCLRLGLLTAAAFALLILLFMRPLLHLLGAGENTFGYARQYVLMVLVLGGIPTICSNVLSNLIRSLGLSRESGIGVALGGV
ncbi:MAG: MATE family efflux transporter, partial [Oscillospiraceae bacterium]|nr:MATE family efflux transporter [Oscillospiraceae bacterium]